MAAIGAGYDLSDTTFSPDGRIFQVEYAQKAVEASGTIIGLKTGNGVVLVVEKILHSRLLKPQVNRRIITIDEHAGMVGAGLIADCRQLGNRAREEAANHRETFDASIPASMLADRLSLYVQAYTAYSSVRPFGSTVILGAIDNAEGGSGLCEADGKESSSSKQPTRLPHLYMIEPSGVSWGYKGCAAGKGRQLAKTEIEKLIDQLEGMSLLEAVNHAARIIHLTHDEAKDKDFELEISWIGPETGYKHQFVPKEILDEANRLAKEALQSRMDY